MKIVLTMPELTGGWHASRSCLAISRMTVFKVLSSTPALQHSTSPVLHYSIFLRPASGFYAFT